MHRPIVSDGGSSAASSLSELEATEAYAEQRALEARARALRAKRPVLDWAPLRYFPHACCVATVVPFALQYVPGWEDIDRAGHLHYRSVDAATGEITYMMGRLDWWTYANMVCLITALKVVVTNFILKPACELFNIKSRRTRRRFVEIAWLTIHYIIAASLGVAVFMMKEGVTERIYVGGFWQFNSTAFWDGWPTPFVHSSYLMKFYYMYTGAFYVHAMCLLMIEPKEKDFPEMFGHHVVTIWMILGSWFTMLTRGGAATLLVMDSGDVLLHLAKTCHYLKLEKMSHGLFALFTVSWVYTRHILLNLILWSVWVEGGSQAIAWDPPTNRFISRFWFTILVGALAVLQLLLVFWLFMILRMIKRMVFDQLNKDVRSDEDEPDPRDEMPQSQQQQQDKAKPQPPAVPAATAAAAAATSSGTVTATTAAGSTQAGKKKAK